MTRVPSLRASDSDREQVAERLRHATAEGRLSTEELEERLGALYASRTYGELDVLVADLPVSRSPDQVRLRVPRWAGAAGAGALLLALVGMLAGAVRHSASAVVPEHPRHFRFPGPLAETHHSFVLAASTVGVLAVVALCAALAWLLLQSRPTSDA